TELVRQLQAEGFPCNSDDAKTFTDQMRYLIDQGYPFGMETAKLALWKQGIELAPEEPEIDPEQESAPAASRIQASVDAFIAERAEKMTDAELEKEIYRRGGFGVPVDAVESLSDADLEKALRANAMI